MRHVRIRLIKRASGLLLTAGLAVVSAACSTGTILASHEPMHPDGGPVTLKATASGHADRIEFRVQRFGIDAESGETELTPVLFIWVCDPPFFVKSLTCAHQLAFSGDAQLVEFQATAVYWNGTRDKEVYRFASGDFPLPDRPVPIRMKRRTEDGIDVVIIPHSDVVPINDLSALRSFRMHLDDVVDGILFEQPIIRDYRALYNFWYSPVSVDFDAGNCGGLEDPVNPENSETIDLEGIADIWMYVHYDDRRNCTMGPKLTTELWYDKSVLHELGHALAGLRDEYAVSTNLYGPRDQMPNTFWNKEDCEKEALLLELPAEYCQQSTPAFNFWRIDPTGPEGCMMGPSQHLTWSDFGPACIRRFKWRYSQCLDGDCIRPPDETPATPEFSSEREKRND